MKLHEITDSIEAIAPLAYQESYDNAGLIVGNADQEVHAVLVCVDVTEDVLDEAIAKHCDLIVSHHPVVFGQLKKINGKNATERIVINAIRNDIAIYAAHTNFDSVFGGVNSTFANQLGLQDQQILAPTTDQWQRIAICTPIAHADEVRNVLFSIGYPTGEMYDNYSFNHEGFSTYRPLKNAHPAAGTPFETHTEAEVRIEATYPAFLVPKVIAALHAVHPYETPAIEVVNLANPLPFAGLGMVGNLPAPLAETEFLSMLKEKLHLHHIRHSALRHKPVKRVAVCGGAGISFLRQAIAQKADAFVTADVKYHDFFASEKRLLLADVGHYESELCAKDALADIILQKFPTFAVLKTEVDTNAIHYF